MRVPDLEDLVTEHERAIRREETGADLLREWQHVLGWIETHDSVMPMFISWVEVAMGRATADPKKRKAMTSMLEQNYPASACRDWVDDKYYDWTRLHTVIRRFVDLAASA